MDVFSAIRGRRSIGKVKPDAVPQELIEQILEAGTWAPNHHRTEPWKFVVLTGEGRRSLGETLARITLEGKEQLSVAEKEELTQKTIALAFRSPVIITIIAIPSDDPKVILQEELAAGHAAVQNMLLAAHALGLGAVWRTGKLSYHPNMKKLFGVDEKGEVLGFIYMGYPDMPIPIGRRTSFSEKTEWRSGAF